MTTPKKNIVQKTILFFTEYAIVLGILGTLASATAFAIYSTYIEPKMIEFIDNRYNTLAEERVKSRPKWFSDRFSEFTGVDKELIGDSLGVMYLNSRNTTKTIKDNKAFIEYQKGLNDFLINQTCTKINDLGIEFIVSVSGDFYYRDEYGYIWDVIYVAQNHKYYYFPKWANGERIECKPL